MELIIHDDYQNYSTSFYLRDGNSPKKEIIGYDGEKLVNQELPPMGEAGFRLKPLLVIPLDMKEPILRAFIASGNKVGIQTENENLLKGKLNATELHLNDLRGYFTKLLDYTIDPNQTLPAISVSQVKK